LVQETVKAFSRWRCALVPGKYDQLHNFVGAGVWDAAPLEAELLVQAERLVGGDNAVLVIDDTALPKKGNHSVGVAAQYASALGKTANCQTLVSATLASGEVPVMVGLRLFLSESWTSDSVRMARARVPEDRQTFRSKPEMMPPRRAFHIEGCGDNNAGTSFKSKEASMLPFNLSDKIQTFRAGDGDPQVSVICGYFRASYGLSINLFLTLRSPIIEQFEDVDHLADNLQSILAELAAGRVGMKAMTAAVLKQIFVMLLRRSLVSAATWSERFAMFSDPQIARAFADMVEMPGAPHSVQSLSQAASLSRAAFMERFQRAFGQSPMLVLRELRMRHAANLLAMQALTVDQMARAVGYNSRSSFSRAFRQAHGFEPKAHRP
jgi:AraC family transcriptional activator of mtrCDE